ncbi:unnamed protein product [Closterium sp. NIES-53]
MYLMTYTRPDLAYPLSILARYVAPGRHRPEHWEATKRVLRYLCSTSGMGLVVGGRGPVFLNGHADASWVDDLATQRSSQGYTFSLGSCSVSWRSTRSFSVSPRDGLAAFSLHQTNQSRCPISQRFSVQPEPPPQLRQQQPRAEPPWLQGLPACERAPPAAPPPPHCTALQRAGAPLEWPGATPAPPAPPPPAPRAQTLPGGGSVGEREEERGQA